MSLRAVMVFSILAASIPRAFAEALASPLDPNPTFVSIVVYDSTEALAGHFGHVDLRFSYGSSP
ncbi:MAG: hypothetical protein ABIR96_01520, partial [Bdellovibrionota bacterium]